MALLKCPECKHDVSDKATACPHCGYPMNSPTSTNHVSEMANLQNYLTGTEQSTNCPESVQNRLGLSKLINGYWMPL